MAKLTYNFKNDVLFKKLFVDHPDLLKRLVSVMLFIPFESITELLITNPEIPPEIVGDKFCRIDINMLVNGMHINLEIQVHDEGDFEKRLMFYWGREFTSALHEGGHYIDLPQTIIISIVAFKMFTCKEYYSRFHVSEDSRHEWLSDVLDIHICELCKLPDVVTADDKRELWLHLFDATTDEELKKIEELEVPEMTQAIEAYRRVTVSPEFIALQRMRDDARRNEASALHNAEKKGIEIGRTEGIGIGRTEGIEIGEERGALRAKKETALEMLSEGVYPIESIARIVKVSTDQVLAWQCES
ncbi:hypothetical protein AGMMS49992_21320 [Clostridia bacterium]|nr:hypothetical protein AGMMS49992_21320 [Clostridia bacterium]